MSVLKGDTLIGKHPLDLLSRASNAELASIGNYGTGAYARFYHSNDANQGSIFGINDAGDLFGSNIAGGVSRLRIDQIQIGSIASTDNATSNLSFNNVNLTGLCNVQIIGSLLDKDGNPYSLSGGSGSGGFADYAVYLPYNPASEAVRVIQTNDTALANRVLFSLTLPAGRYYLNGVIPYTNVDSLVPINSTNWASVNIYNGTLAMYTSSTATLVQATPFFSTTAVVGATQYLAFTVFVDTLADSPTAQNFVVAVEGTGHRLAFTLADVTVKGIPVQTSTGLGTSAGDSILVSRKISIAPIRTVTAIPEGETSNAFNISIPGNFVATASNTDVYLNGTKYVYQDATNYDYSVVYNYNAINDTTLFTVALSGDALAGDIVDITVWPEAYTSNYFVSGKFYQSTAVTSSPWQKVVSSVPSIRYPGNLIVDGTIFLGGDIYGGCNVRDFTSGIEFDRSVLGTLSCNIIGTLNLANYSVTPAKLNLTGGNVGVGTTIPVQTLDVRGSIRLDGAMYDASNNPIWLPSSSIQWNASPTPPTFTMPGGAVLSYGRSNGVYRWIGDDFAYNINVSATVATAPGGPLTPAGSNYLLTLPYPVLSASYPTATIIGDLWLTTTNPTEGAGTSNMFKAYAATIPANANSATIRALTGTTDESLAVLTVGTQFTLQGTLVYRTTTINQSFTVPALYTQSSVIQDQDGNLGINLPPPTMPRGGFDIYSSNAVIPALVVDQRSTGDIVSLREAGVTVVTVDGNGNVGIGTTTPTAPLHVLGNARVAGEQTVTDLDITGYNYAPVSSAPHVAFSAATSNVFLRWMQRTTTTLAGSWWQTPATPSYSTIGGMPGSAAYAGGVLLPDGRVVLVPFNTTIIGLFNPTTNTYSTIAGAPSNYAYRGGVLLPDGRVVFVPSYATTIGIFNPLLSAYSTIAGTAPGTDAYRGGVLLSDGRVVFVPFNATMIGIFNPITNSYSTIAGMPGVAAYDGGVLLPDGRVVFVPFNSTTIGIFNSTTNIYSTIAGAPGGGAYIGGVLLPDGRVVFVPSNATTIGIFNPTTNLYSTIAGMPGGAAYAGGVLLPDGRVVFVPANATTIGIFNPATNAYSTISGPGISYVGGVLLPDGRVIFAPYNSATISILSGFAAPPRELCYHPCFNKY
jgi:hypothetical protein